MKPLAAWDPNSVLEFGEVVLGCGGLPVVGLNQCDGVVHLSACLSEASMTLGTRLSFLPSLSHVEKNRK